MGKNLGKIQIIRQEYAVMKPTIFADLAILGSHRTNNRPMDCLMARLDQVADPPRG